MSEKLATMGQLLAGVRRVSAGELDRGVPVRAEIELAWRYCPAPVIAVTGSKGKSTTTALIGHLLQAAGCAHVVAGNIGLPFSAVVQGLSPRAWAVLEISSFQLESVDLFRYEPSSVRFYDRCIFPLSRLLDPCFRHSFGKNLFAVAQKV